MDLGKTYFTCFLSQMNTVPNILSISWAISIPLLIYTAGGDSENIWDFPVLALVLPSIQFLISLFQVCFVENPNSCEKLLIQIQGAST